MATEGNTDIWAKWLRAAVMVVAVLAAVPCVASETALVRFRPEVVVSGAVVRMADVADIHAADPEWVDRVGAVTLHPAPAAGRSVKIDYESIRSRLIAQGI